MDIEAFSRLISTQTLAVCLVVYGVWVATRIARFFAPRIDRTIDSLESNFAKQTEIVAKQGESIEGIDKRVTEIHEVVVAKK